MYISLPLFSDMATLPKNQVRLLKEVATSNDPTTNVGYVSYEKLTPSQAQRMREDARQLIQLGYLRKYPMTKASLAMRTLQISHSRRLNFFMLNPIHLHAQHVAPQGLKEIWLLLK